MRSTDLYGFQDGDMEEARRAVEQALGITFSQCHNIYRGAHYEASGNGELVCILQANWEALDAELMEEQFPDMRVLLYVNGGDRSEEIARLLTTRTSAHLLMRQEEL